MARSINFAYEVVSFLSLAGTTQTNKLQMSRFILNLWTRFSLFPRFPRTLKALAQYFPLCSLKIYVLKKFVPSSLPPPRTHFDFITTKCMITTVCSTIDSFINLDQWCHQEKPSHVETKLFYQNKSAPDNEFDLFLVLEIEGTSLDQSGLVFFYKLS